jgi:hypothetical protein
MAAEAQESLWPLSIQNDKSRDTHFKAFTEAGFADTGGEQRGDKRRDNPPKA